MSLYSVYFFAGKPATTEEGGPKEQTRTIKLGPRRPGESHHVTKAVGSSFVFTSGLAYSIVDRHKMLRIRILVLFYLFTMLLFLCLSANPYVCVTRFTIRDVPLCVCV